MGKKNDKVKKEMDKLLSGEMREVMAIEIMIGNGGITGGFRFDQKVDKKMRECFGKEYEKIFDEFRELGQEPAKDVGRKLAKLIIKKGIGSEVGEGLPKEEISELLVKLGELLGKGIDLGKIEIVGPEDEDDEDDEEDEEDEEDED